MGRGKNINAKDKMSRKEKQEMRKEHERTSKQLKTLVMPTIGIISFLIIVYVWIKTRSFSNIAEPYDEY